ncbi:hypothetical protein Vafri_7451 [Volvox africanus]|uniref:Uncharacterized protein n=1 Tax=Volvox africanus TaxID=51714 RepID=A0A8J4B0A9_9CHLO|nr:hypothetical protein Vafri_7451 [Volvox africanus]
MLASEFPDTGQKLEELQRTLARSQALLAELECHYPKHVTEEECATDCCADDEVQEEEPQSLLESSSGLANFKTKLTQWFSKRTTPTALKKSEAALTPGRLSFSRVNIEFPSDGTSPDTPALSSGLLSPSQQLPTFQQSRHQRSWPNSHHAAVPSTARGMPVIASSLSLPINSSFPTSLLGSSSTSPIQAPVMTPLLPKPHPAEASVSGSNVSRRSSWGDAVQSRSQSQNNTLPPALQQQRRIIFRDTVWSTSPEILAAAATALLPAVSSMVQNSQICDAAAAVASTNSPTEPMSVPPKAISRDGGVTSCTGSPIGNIRDRLLTDAQMSLLPPLHGANKAQRVLPPGGGLGSDLHSTCTMLEQGVSNLHAKSFTLGSTQAARLGVNGVSVQGSGCDDTSRCTTVRSNLRVSSWLDRPGFPTSAGKAEAEGESGQAMSDRARIREQKHQFANQPGQLQRFVSIPEVETRRTASARKLNGRSNSGHSILQFVGASPAVLAAAAAREAANPVRGQTFNNEVFLQDPATRD